MQTTDAREPLARALRAYPASGPDGDARDRILQFVLTNERCFERTLATGHVTGSAWVVDRTGRFALLTHHRKLARWLQLGGHADGDPDVRAVALREAIEESGLTDLAGACEGIYDLDVHAIPARPGEPEHLHYDVRFAFFGDPSHEPVASAESHAVAWVPLEHIDRYAIDASVRRLVAKTPALVRPS